jgi:hypothetical protein
MKGGGYTADNTRLICPNAIWLSSGHAVTPTPRTGPTVNVPTALRRAGESFAASLRGSHAPCLVPAECQPVVFTTGKGRSGTFRDISTELRKGRKYLVLTKSLRLCGQGENREKRLRKPPLYPLSYWRKIWEY